MTRTIYHHHIFSTTQTTSINLNNFAYQFMIMLIQMPKRNGHPVDPSTQFWQPRWYACVRVHHTCYRLLLIRSKIIYLDVSSATSRGAQPSSRQKRPSSALQARARWGLSKYFTQLTCTFLQAISCNQTPFDEEIITLAKTLYAVRSVYTNFLINGLM